MDFTVHPDPGELKSNSRFVKCKGVSDLNLQPLPGLEERTGADILISPNGLPNPINETLLNMHLQKGALLVQLKFSFDLISSIIDGRYKQSQIKMLATGASGNQIILLFIGHIFEAEDKSTELRINGQYVSEFIPSAKNFRQESYFRQARLWSHRGGTFEQITLDSSLKPWIESAAKVAFGEPANKQVWQPKQKMLLIDDWRNLLVNLPGVGERKADDIYDSTNGSFYEFLAVLEDETLTDVPGIGPGTIKTIQDYLKGV